MCTRRPTTWYQTRNSTICVLAGAYPAAFTAELSCRGDRTSDKQSKSCRVDRILVAERAGYRGFRRARRGTGIRRETPDCELHIGFFGGFPVLSYRCYGTTGRIL